MSTHDPIQSTLADTDMTGHGIPDEEMAAGPIITTTDKEEETMEYDRHDDDGDHHTVPDVDIVDEQREEDLTQADTVSQADARMVEEHREEEQASRITQGEHNTQPAVEEQPPPVDTNPIQAETQAPTTSHQDASADLNPTLTAPPPIHLIFNDQSFALFSTDSQSTSYLSWDEAGTSIISTPAPPLPIPVSAFHSTLDTFFESLRVPNALGDFLQEDHTELILEFPELELTIGEDNVHTQSVGLTDLQHLHTASGLQDSLCVKVTEAQRFISLYNLLAEQVQQQQIQQFEEEGGVEGAGHAGERADGEAEGDQTFVTTRGDQDEEEDEIVEYQEEDEEQVKAQHDEQDGQQHGEPPQDSQDHDGQEEGQQIPDGQGKEGQDDHEQAIQAAGDSGGHDVEEPTDGSAEGHAQQTAEQPAEGSDAQGQPLEDGHDSTVTAPRGDAVDAEAPGANDDDANEPLPENEGYDADTAQDTEEVYEYDEYAEGDQGDSVPDYEEDDGTEYPGTSAQGEEGEGGDLQELGEHEEAYGDEEAEAGGEETYEGEEEQETYDGDGDDDEETHNADAEPDTATASYDSIASSTTTTRSNKRSLDEGYEVQDGAEGGCGVVNGVGAGSDAAANADADGTEKKKARVS